MRNAENCLSLTPKLEREDAFPIRKWLLNPQRAIVVEQRNALCRRHKIRPTLPRYFFYKCDDRPFTCAIIPRWERVGLSMRFLRAKWVKPEREWQNGRCRE